MTTVQSFRVCDVYNNQLKILVCVITGNTEGVVQHTRSRGVPFLDGHSHVIINKKDYNKAFPGDLVSVQVHPSTSVQAPKQSDPIIRNHDIYQNKFLRTPKNDSACYLESSSANLPRTGSVKAILQKSFRTVHGSINLSQKASIPDVVIFQPQKGTFPMALIKKSDLPPEVFNNKNDGKIYLATYYDWPANSLFPFAKIKTLVEDSHDITFSVGIELEAFDLNHGDFPPHVLLEAEKLKATPNIIEPPGVLLPRENMTDRCVISIDPSTAKDVDDALHIRHISKDLIEVGVHIADVAHYVQENSAIDKIAALRTTTVYMPHKAIPMLPPILSEDLCSLIPGAEKLAFSVIFVFNKAFEVVSKRFVKSIIKPRLKLSYEEAEELLDDANTLSETYSAIQSRLTDFSMQQVVSDLKVLLQLATKLRADRFKNNALPSRSKSINFVVAKATSDDDSTEWPVSWYTKRRGKSDYLIEEMMLLTNFSVASFLLKSWLQKNIHKNSINTVDGLLRRHPWPQPEKLQELAKLLVGTPHELNTNSPEALAASLAKLRKTKQVESYIHTVYTLMQSAEYFSLQSVWASYFCPSSKDQDTNLKDFYKFMFHFGLSLPNYTHFTSPIRRYADLLVHRQMALILSQQNFESSKKIGSEYFQAFNPTALQQHAQLCNMKRLACKRLHDRCNEIFLAAFLKNSGSMAMSGSVRIITPNVLITYIPNVGFEVKIPLPNRDNCKTKIVKVEKQNKSNGFVIHWGPVEDTEEPLCKCQKTNVTQNIHAFSPVSCLLECHPSSLSIQGSLLRPICKDCNLKVSVVDQNDVE